MEKTGDRKPWSLTRAALFGLTLIVVLESLHINDIAADYVRYDLAQFIAAMIGRFAVGPALFVLIALIRNTVVSRRPVRS